MLSLKNLLHHLKDIYPGVVLYMRGKVVDSMIDDSFPILSGTITIELSTDLLMYCATDVGVRRTLNLSLVDYRGQAIMLARKNRKHQFY